ncbi:MAG: WbqC family protein [candidate division KSB1 bacterium]|nr:WbqC family protein [candidate division KSB1 bacterium]MDZ7302757.1 WbqC family protein [candidate division KSB1 bacterium]MDZ7310075.1 WbqC family protein [candidate division KSB1 bacterium]
MRTLAAEILSYLPSENFFVLAASADIFVVADDIQFSTSGNANRTRIKTVTGTQWLTIPVLSKGRGLQKLNEVEIDSTRPWQRQHWRTIEFNYHNAPFFGELADGLAELYQRPFRKLADASWAFLEFIWKALGWEDLPKRSSELGITATGEARLEELAKRMNAEVYLAHERYRAVVRPERMSEVRVQFVHWDLPPYHQQFDAFVGGLNILDLLFNEGMAFTRERLRRLADLVHARVKLVKYE